MWECSFCWFCKHWPSMPWPCLVLGEIAHLQPAAYHSWMAIPLRLKTGKGPPMHLYLDSWKHLLQNVARFNLFARTIRVGPVFDRIKTGSVTTCHWQVGFEWGPIWGTCSVHLSLIRSLCLGGTAMKLARLLLLNEDWLQILSFDTGCLVMNGVFLLRRWKCWGFIHFFIWGFQFTVWYMATGPVHQDGSLGLLRMHVCICLWDAIAHERLGLVLWLSRDCLEMKVESAFAL